MSLVNLRDKSNNSAFWEPEKILEDLLDQLNKKELKADGIVVIVGNDEDTFEIRIGKYTTAQAHYKLALAMRLLEGPICEED